MKGLDEKAAGKWLQFCRGFSPRSAADGLFVLEVHGNITATESKHIQYINFDDCVSSYDVQQFNCFILDDQKLYTTNWKRYISTTVAAVCGVDAEISEMLLKVVDFRDETAIDGLKRINEMGDFERRGTEKDSDHPLWHFRNNTTAELSHRIWTAQIQVLFPIIELERQKLIEKWHSAIETALKENEVTQFGAVITAPAEADRERIRFLHDCRNKLAHMNCCTPNEVASLLDGSF